MIKTTIYGLTKKELLQWFLDAGEKKFRATQTWDWLYNKRAASFEAMTNLSKATIAKLTENFSFNPLTLVKEKEQQAATDYSFQLADGANITTTLMHHDYGLSAYVASQADDDDERNLSTGELVAQVVTLQHYLDEKETDERISHIMVIGQEPLADLTSVLGFLKIVNDQAGLEIGARHMTVTTNGLADKIQRFANVDLQVNLAITLNAPSNDLRSRLVPTNRDWSLDRLFNAVHFYVDRTNRRITFQYVMLKDVNDQPEDALQLVNLLKDIHHLAYVNLIPYQALEDDSRYAASSRNRQLAFFDVLKKQGINTVIRNDYSPELMLAIKQLK
ncbi:23S rRNA (adenine(2503)-C(2))-methyltransferase RlmN [Loigolactobacillus backii]|uniref:23S rRNA (adenine(2503)-C(2))-methyltransferase RlmN n=1 Tax=Loigolactobacillus backii TaxID=375175 RepID=UPI0007F183C1|nr:23S rRNA (adenine(2503)-C(2))-methyltransferase RlmN [Loigolactobacillus backii]ANK60252.1 23S rRNA (adenine(2503)-C(2))-methyltransferase RlmN [Loigolactobacillus backii]ANK65134.1 23S rRNA (adenine(2503)-C(2))-methyltransferase RlmN [Loigolactobacillus backii]ANK67693.1 23S rRNA (adenine(2503)-C(2))-methyltransferase RlmN [Loigolactobacillus backii]OLF70173.1 ribosomal RNA large subunit methyltransferase N [Loigolactobacillus backii]PIO87081.1 23S rRNA (adenine(2503)-C(2))-methyltransfera